jgi:hypothetical protein
MTSVHDCGLCNEIDIYRISVRFLRVIDVNRPPSPLSNADFTWPTQCTISFANV